MFATALHSNRNEEKINLIFSEHVWGKKSIWRLGDICSEGSLWQLYNAFISDGNLSVGTFSLGLNEKYLETTWCSLVGLFAFHHILLFLDPLRILFCWRESQGLFWFSRGSGRTKSNGQAPWMYYSWTVVLLSSNIIFFYCSSYKNTLSLVLNTFWAVAGKRIWRISKYLKEKGSNCCLFLKKPLILFFPMPYLVCYYPGIC